MRAEPLLDGRPFFLLLPHHVFWSARPAAGQMLSWFQEYGETILGLMEVNYETAPLFGNCGAVTFEAIEENVFVVHELKDKMPGRFKLGEAGTAVRACGRFILQSDFFEASMRFDSARLRERGEVPVIQELIARGKVKGVLLKGDLFDCGDPDGYGRPTNFG